MSKRFGGGGGSASALANWNPSPKVPAPGQPAKVESKPTYSAPPAQPYHPPVAAKPVEPVHHAPVHHAPPTQTYTAPPAQPYVPPAAAKPEPAPYHPPVQTYQAKPEPVAAVQPRQKQPWELPPTEAVFGTKYEHMLLAELVSARTNPHVNLFLFFLRIYFLFSFSIIHFYLDFDSSFGRKKKTFSQ